MNTDRRFWQIAFLTSLFIGLLILGYILSGVLNPIIVALVIAYILNPLVTLIQDKGASRFTAVVLVFIVLLLLFVVGLIFIIPLAYHELMALVELVQTLDYQKIANTIIQWASIKLEQWNQRFPGMTVKEEVIIDRVKTFLQNNLESIGMTASNLSLSVINVMGSGLSVLGTILSYLVLLPIYTFFFLLHLDDIWNGIRGHLPLKHEKKIVQVLNKIHVSISGFFRGQLMVCLIKGVIVGIALSIFDIKYAILLGGLAFLGSFVPFMIMLISFIPAVLIVLLTQGFAWVPLIQVACVYGAVDILEGTILYPFIVGKEAGVHPLLIIVSLLIGGNLFGFFGVLLSIPLGSTAVILTRNVVLPQLKEVMGRKQSDDREEEKFPDLASTEVDKKETEEDQPEDTENEFDEPEDK